MGTNWPKWVRIDQTVSANWPNEYELTKLRMSWLEYELTWVRIDWEPLCNWSLAECCFPKSWKVANVVPILKKGDKTSISNYKPVSLLSCCGKHFERIVFKHMYNVFLENNVLYKYQSGFLPNQSTAFQLVDIFHICLSIFRQQTDLVYVFLWYFEGFWPCMT